MLRIPGDSGALGARVVPAVNASLQAVTMTKSRVSPLWKTVDWWQDVRHTNKDEKTNRREKRPQKEVSTGHAKKHDHAGLCLYVVLVLYLKTETKECKGKKVWVNVPQSKGRKQQ